MKFTYKLLSDIYESILEHGYNIETCKDYVLNKAESKQSKILVNRIDVDFSLKKSEPILDIFDELGIHATFFVRLHAPEYNPFSFENYRILKRIQKSGHEIGYHSEIIDQSVIWNESAITCLKRDVKVLEDILGEKIYGVASHGGMTGLNNLDFWKDHKPSDFGLLYEAYDKENMNLFEHSLYISDSEWTNWKYYKNGKLLVGDNQLPQVHLNKEHGLIYFLIHTDTFYHSHFYERDN